MEMGICQVLFRQLTQNLSYVQKTGCCVLGEGYGPTLAGLIMAADTEGLVKCGALINPVTDWRHMGESAAVWWGHLKFKGSQILHLLTLLEFRGRKD